MQYLRSDEIRPVTAVVEGDQCTDQGMSKSGTVQLPGNVVRLSFNRLDREAAAGKGNSSLSQIIGRQTKALKLAVFAMDSLDLALDKIRDCQLDLDIAQLAELDRSRLELCDDLNHARRCVLQIVTAMASCLSKHFELHGIRQDDLTAIKESMSAMLFVMKKENARLHIPTGASV